LALNPNVRNKPDVYQGSVVLNLTKNSNDIKYYGKIDPDGLASTCKKGAACNSLEWPRRHYLPVHSPWLRNSSQDRPERWRGVHRPRRWAIARRGGKGQQARCVPVQYHSKSFITESGKAALADFNCKLKDDGTTGECYATVYYQVGSGVTSMGGCKRYLIENDSQD